MDNKKLKSKLTKRDHKNDLKLARLLSDIDKLVYDVFSTYFTTSYQSDNISLIQLNSLKNRLQSEGLDQLLAENSTDLFNDRVSYIKADLSQYAVDGSLIITQESGILIRNMILSNVQEISKIIDSYTQRVIREAILAKITNKNFKYPEVHKKILPKFTQELSLSQETNLDGFQRAMSNRESEKLGLNYFIYEGGLIQTSRQFCISRAGKIFHRDDLATWDNGQGIPASIYLGGYRCRHQINWISDSFAKDRGAYKNG